MASTSKQQPLLRQRLLNDIAELQQKPYPGIALHINDKDALSCACLILSPKGEPPLHLSVDFTPDYPLEPPEITMQSKVQHPNVFDDGYICISMLDTTEGYTPAYTLKGICIQMLSFFASDNVEQMHGGRSINRKHWQARVAEYDDMPVDSHRCFKCGFGETAMKSNGDSITEASLNDATMMVDADLSASSTSWQSSVGIADLPNEVLLLICERLDEEALFLAARAWNGFGRVLRQFNVIRTRSLRCFTLKKDFNQVQLGVGVRLEAKSIQSEFDILSSQAFYELSVRESIQGIPFEYWLPLPLSQRHWEHVRDSACEVLKKLVQAVPTIRAKPPVTAIYAFMNDVAVRLSQDAAGAKEYVPRMRWDFDDECDSPKSTLTHASEKAIESYFHLYHLLLCLATEQPTIVQQANDNITNFMNGKCDKNSCPNLGHLLIMVLISGTGVSHEELIKAIIKEAVTRNVVWMLDRRGADMPELSFMETDAVSEYRLQKTFEASKTSYSLLMFVNLMRRVVAPNSGGTNIALIEKRDELFARHGGPPNEAASRLANSVRDLEKVDNFPAFLKAMDISQIPTKSDFTAFLRKTVNESVKKGYSKWALSQSEALALRYAKERTVGRAVGVTSVRDVKPYYTFFPNDERDRRAQRGRR